MLSNSLFSIVCKNKYFFTFNKSNKNLINTLYIQNKSNFYFFKGLIPFYFVLYLNLFFFKSSFINNFNYINFIFNKLKTLNFYFKFLAYRIFKMYGINMRFLKWEYDYFFLKIGFSHGFIFKLQKNCLVYIFKKRYFICLSYDYNFLNSFSFLLCTLRKFFKYKLIGIKLDKDFLILKAGKKKVF